MRNKYSETFILSLGGSMICPPSGVDGEFLNKFSNFIRKQVSAKNRRFFIVCGGGDICRKYQEAGRKATNGKATDEDIDWLGTHSTRLNAHLVRTVFADIAHPRIIEHYEMIEKTEEPVIVASGWKPGWSSDYDAVILAEDYGAEKVINMSNIEKVYTADPKKDPHAKPIDDISWKEYRAIVGDKWTPGFSAPFDPIASRLAEELKLNVYVIEGHNFDNLEAILDNKKFVGTIIHS